MFTPPGCKDKGIIKFLFAAKTQFLLDRFNFEVSQSLGLRFYITRSHIFILYHFRTMTLISRFILKQLLEKFLIYNGTL